MVFPEAYKAAEKVPIMLSIDVSNIKVNIFILLYGIYSLMKNLNRPKFKTADELVLFLISNYIKLYFFQFKYSTTIEERVIAAYEKKNPPQASTPKFETVLQPTKAQPGSTNETKSDEPKKTDHLKEFDQTSPENPWDVKTSVEEDVKQLGDILEQAKIRESTPSQTAMDIANSYLRDDTEEKVCFKHINKHLDIMQKLVFAKVVDKAFAYGCSEVDALRGFFLFDGDQTKVLSYIDGFVMLRDLGHSQEKIDDALFKSDLDQGKALEILMGL